MQYLLTLQVTTSLYKWAHTAFAEGITYYNEGGCSFWGVYATDLHVQVCGR